MVNAALEDWIKSSWWNNYLSLVAIAILYYDYALTIGDEVDFFWKSARFSFSSFLFVFNRYFSLIGILPIILEYFAHLPEHVRCRMLQTYHQALSVVIQAVIAIILLLRTYALYERNKPVLVLLIVTLVAVAVVCLVATTTSQSPEAKPDSPTQDPHGGCDLSLTKQEGIHLAIQWGAMLWFDTTVFLLTLIRALRMDQRLPGGIVNTLFRDGAIYYGILVVLNVSNIITFLVLPAGSKKGLTTTLTNVLSTTLTSRLFLNLRDIGSRRWRRTAEESSTIHYRIPNSMVSPASHMRFASQRASLIEEFEMQTSLTLR